MAHTKIIIRDNHIREEIAKMEDLLSHISELAKSISEESSELEIVMESNQCSLDSKN